MNTEPKRYWLRAHYIPTVGRLLLKFGRKSLLCSRVVTHYTSIHLGVVGFRRIPIVHFRLEVNE